MPSLEHNMNTLVTSTAGLVWKAGNFVSRFQLQAPIQKLFRAIDTDNNGTISKSELLSFLHAVKSVLDPDQIRNSIFAKEESVWLDVYYLVDADRSGSISLKACETLCFLFAEHRTCSCCERLVTDEYYHFCSSCEVCLTSHSSCHVCNFCWETRPNTLLQHAFERVSHLEGYSAERYELVDFFELMADYYFALEDNDEVVSLDSSVVEDVPLVQCVVCLELHETDAVPYLGGVGCHVIDVGDGRHICEFCSKWMCKRCGVIGVCLPQTAKEGMWTATNYKCSHGCKKAEGGGWSVNVEEVCAKAADPRRAHCQACRRNLIQRTITKGRRQPPTNRHRHSNSSCSSRPTSPTPNNLASLHSPRTSLNCHYQPDPCPSAAHQHCLPFHRTSIASQYLTLDGARYIPENTRLSPDYHYVYDTNHASVISYDSVNVTRASVNEPCTSSRVSPNESTGTNTSTSFWQNPTTSSKSRYSSLSFSIGHSRKNKSVTSPSSPLSQSPGRKYSWSFSCCQKHQTLSTSGAPTGPEVPEILTVDGPALSVLFTRGGVEVPELTRKVCRGGTSRTRLGLGCSIM